MFCSVRTSRRVNSHTFKLRVTIFPFDMLLTKIPKLLYLGISTSLLLSLLQFVSGSANTSTFRLCDTMKLTDYRLIFIERKERSAFLLATASRAEIGAKAIEAPLCAPDPERERCALPPH